MRYTTISSRPDPSVLPRAQSGYTREHVHGPLQGMDEAQLAWRPIGPLSRWLTRIAIAGAVALFAYHGGWFVWDQVMKGMGI